MSPNVDSKIIITSRELQVLKLASEGRSSDLIASEINIRVHESKKNLKSVCGKLKVKDPLAAMQRLLKNDFEVVD